MTSEIDTTHEHTMVDEALRIAGELEAIQLEMNATTRNQGSEFLEAASLVDQWPTPNVDMTDLVDVRIASKTPVITPGLLERRLPLSQNSADTTRQGRIIAEQIIKGTDDRLLVIVGPCSLHDPEAALEYASRVAGWRKEYGANLEVVMRAYTEKPRSTIGWKGMTYDPLLDNSSNINLGLTLTRMLARKITDMGVPTAMERLNGLTPQYLNGLVAYDAIGARNVADQNAREYGSATSSIIGIKNGTDGGVSDAADAIETVNAPHNYPGSDMDGNLSKVKTTGNDTAHLILRGGKSGPNYSTEKVQEAKRALTTDRIKNNKSPLLEAIVVDASHGNSEKDYRNQIKVIESVAGQIALGELALRGVMIESNLVEGAQKIGPLDTLEKGKSVTDSCVDVEETTVMLTLLSQAVETRRKIIAENTAKPNKQAVMA
jgi:3-deoxy-7-phosphoheptulonate synthase